MKYTKVQIQEMAAEFLTQLTGHNDTRCHQLIGEMSRRFNVHPNVVQQGIHMLALGMSFDIPEAA